MHAVSEIMLRENDEEEYGEEECEEEEEEDEDEDEDEGDEDDAEDSDDEDKTDEDKVVKDESWGVKNDKSLVLVASKGQAYVDLDFDKKKFFIAEASSKTRGRAVALEALIAAGSNITALNVREGRA